MPNHTTTNENHFYISPLFKHVFLAILIILFAATVGVYIYGLPHSKPFILVVPVMLILNHISFVYMHGNQSPTAKAFRIFTILYLIIGSLYIFYIVIQMLRAAI